MNYLSVKEIQENYENLENPVIVGMEKREFNTLLQIAQKLDDVPSGTESSLEEGSFAADVASKVNTGHIYTTLERVPNTAVEKFDFKEGKVLDKYKIQVRHTFKPAHELQQAKLTYNQERELVTAKEKESGREFYETTSLVRKNLAEHKIFDYVTEVTEEKIESKMEETPLFG